MPVLRSFALAGALVGVMLAGASPAVAHQSPAGCQSSRLSGGIEGAETIKRNGDVISFTPSFGNAGPGACDVTDVTVKLWLPSPDGTPKTGQAVIVAEDLSLPAGTPPTAQPAVDYAVGFNDGVFRSPATIELSGSLHSGPLDAPTVVSRSTNVVISRPHVTLSVSPEPASGLAPLAVAYTLRAINDSPFDPNVGAVQPGVAEAQVADDRCAPVARTGGDTDGDGVLDRGEAWSYACTAVFGAGAFIDTATFTGTSALDGRAWPAATAQSIVTATVPDAPATPEDRARLTLRLFALSPTTFRAARSGPAIAARKKKVGTRGAFSLSEASVVGFTVDRRLPGRKVAKRCVRPRRANRTRRSCARWVRIKGSFAIASGPGKRTFEFSGRVRGRRLAPGRYRLNGAATDSAGNRSAIRRKPFRIVR